jgi:hypothetical protein
MATSADAAALPGVLLLRAGWSVRRDAPAGPVTPRSHEVFPPTLAEGARSRSIPHRVPSSAPGPVVLTHRIVANHSPPSIVNHTLDASFHPLIRAQ